MEDAETIIRDFLEVCERLDRYSEGMGDVIARAEVYLEKKDTTP